MIEMSSPIEKDNSNDNSQTNELSPVDISIKANVEYDFPPFFDGPSTEFRNRYETQLSSHKYAPTAYFKSPYDGVGGAKRIYLGTSNRKKENPTGNFKGPRDIGGGLIKTFIRTVARLPISRYR
jgi:hypothetical protein